MKHNYLVILAACLLTSACSVSAQDGLILPMPGQSSTQTPSPSKPNKSDTPKQQNSNNQQNNKHNNSSKTGDGILPMPDLTNKRETNQSPSTNKSQNNKKQTISNDSNGETLISLPTPEKTETKSQEKPKKKPEKKEKPKKAPKNNTNKVPLSIDDDDSGFFSNEVDLPDWDDEISDSSETLESPDKLDELLSSASKPETPVTQDTSTGETIKVYPKDTGAAIFMVMKSWNCQDYDAVSLINQAHEVYGKEAGEEYKIQGLENITKGLNVTVEEEDITYDELLDIIAAKSGNDWGCDIPNKTIYVYPKGIKTESFLSWDDE